MKILSALLDLLYPPKCVFCRKLLQTQNVDMCADCRGNLPVVIGSLKRGECYRTCYAAYYYEDDVAESIKRFKFRGQRQYADAYGRILAMLILRNCIEFDVLTWVPISDCRAKERGYRQTELLACATANELGIGAVRTLTKIKDNPAQSSLPNSTARKRNVKDAYKAYAPEKFSGKHILLIDDVITSGATLSECSRTLLKAGAKSVVCVTLAAVRN